MDSKTKNKLIDNHKKQFQEYVNHGKKMPLEPETPIGIVHPSQLRTVPLRNPNNHWRDFLCVEKMDKEAILPTQGSSKSAGYDLYSFCDLVVPAWGKVRVPTQLRIAMPPGTYGRIAPRSGLSFKHDIEVGAGVIDIDYSDEIGVILRNFSNHDYTIKKGDRIAQLILENHITPPIKEMENIKKEKVINTKVAPGRTAISNALKRSNIATKYLFVEKIHADAIMPKREVYNKVMSSGYYLYAFDNMIIPKWGKACMPTKLRIVMPAGVYGRIAPLYSLSHDLDIEIGAGVIDADYSGELGVIMRNFSDKPCEIKKGTAVAQLILERYTVGQIKEINNVKEILKDGDRNGGFGSTGK